MTRFARAKPFTHTDAPRPAPRLLLPTPHVDGLERPSGRNRIFLRDHPINHHVAGPPHGRSRTEISPGARAHRPADSASTAPVKRFALGPQAALRVTGRRRRRSPTNQGSATAEPENSRPDTPHTQEDHTRLDTGVPAQISNTSGRA